MNKCLKKILLFTTFNTDVSDESKNEVINGLQKEDIELIVVWVALNFNNNNNIINDNDCKISSICNV